MTLFDSTVDDLIAESDDAEVRAVASALVPLLDHIPLAIHEAKMLVLAPEKTGRLDILAAEVDPEEKSYVGKRTEINFLTASGLPRRGGRLDTVIAGVDVDIKTSLTGTVMIAPKNVDHIVVRIEHFPKKDTYRVGVVRASNAYLNTGRSRDAKRTLNAAGRLATIWVVPEAPMPEELRNPLAHMPPALSQSILGERSGQAKLNALFAACLDTPIPRWLVVALGQQLDPAKRVRDSRLKLEPQGIRILSTRYDRPELARLGLNPPASPAFFFSTRRL